MAKIAINSILMDAQGTGVRTFTVNIISALCGTDQTNEYLVYIKPGVSLEIDL